MDTPGPFEKGDQAYYNMTLPDPRGRGGAGRLHAEVVLRR